jgi:hypothetical protein
MVVGDEEGAGSSRTRIHTVTGEAWGRGGLEARWRGTGTRLCEVVRKALGPRLAACVLQSCVVRQRWWCPVSGGRKGKRLFFIYNNICG